MTALVDDRTVNYNLPKPHISNAQTDDVARLRTSLDAIDTQMKSNADAAAAAATTAAGKADLVGGKVPAAQLPSYVDDVLEFANLAAFPNPGEAGKIYVAIDTNKTYRWSGSVYVPTNEYTLPIASAATLGGIKIGAGLTVDPVTGAVSVSGGSAMAFTEYILTPSVGGQTSFAVPGGYVPGTLIVELNGSTLTGGGDDYTATDGVNVVLTTGISSPSHLQVFVFASFQVADAIQKAGGTLLGALNHAAHVSVASAATVNLGAANSNRVIITGTTGITSLGTAAAGVARTVTFAAALTLTHNATSLILPGAANITTAAGDTAEFESLGAGNWRCTWYQRADGKALVGSPVQQAFTDIAVNTAAVALMRYRLTASLDLTLPAAPADGDWVEVVNHSGTTTARVLRNGQNIGGLAEDLTIDALNAALTLVFRTGYGWIIK